MVHVSVLNAFSNVLANCGMRTLQIMAASTLAQLIAHVVNLLDYVTLAGGDDMLRPATTGNGSTWGASPASTLTRYSAASDRSDEEPTLISIAGAACSVIAQLAIAGCADALLDHMQAIMAHFPRLLMTPVMRQPSQQHQDLADAASGLSWVQIYSASMCAMLQYYGYSPENLRFHSSDGQTMASIRTYSSYEVECDRHNHDYSLDYTADFCMFP